jgi:hypothetical protein
MPDWDVLRQIFGEYAGPLQVLLVFSVAPNRDEVNSLQHVVPFEVDPVQFYSDELHDFMEIFCNLLRVATDIDVQCDNLLVVNFKNERDVRAEGAAFLMRLVSNANLIAAYKMSDADMEEVFEFDRRRENIFSLMSASEEMRAAVETYILRKVNPPKKYMKNYNEIVEMYGRFRYAMYESTIWFDIDPSKIISVDGRCDHFLNLLKTISSDEIAEFDAEVAGFLKSLKIM